MSLGLVLFILATIGVLIGLYGMFRKAGIEPWKGLIPFYNTWCMVEKMELNKIWFFLQFIPIAGQFVTIWIFIKFVEHFGRFGLGHHFLTVFVPFIYFPYLGFSDNERYAGTAVVKNYKKGGIREWIDAAVFAIVAATLIRTFVFEAYTIPTPSMEKTLLVNDFLFVSKFAYGPRIHGLAANRADMEAIVEAALRRAGLWDEVKDRLGESGTALSGGQQQRLCIARAIAVDPEVILMDEPCSALDPVATAKIEELIDELRARYAIVIVTHNMQQAARVSQNT